MTTTINRSGQVTALAYKDKQQSAIINFRGGYVKFYFDDTDIPNGLMLKDKVEITLVIQAEE